MKKSAETIFTRLDKLVVSTMKTAAITKANVAPLLNINTSKMAMTIGVKISAAPSFAKTAQTETPNKIIQVNNSRPFTIANLATCKADHSKNQIRLRTNLL